MHTRAFIIGVLLNSLFVIIEFAYGVYAGSLALIADAGHNLTDVLGLLLAWGARSVDRASHQRPKGRLMCKEKPSTETKQIAGRKKTSTPQAMHSKKSMA